MSRNPLFEKVYEKIVDLSTDPASASDLLRYLAEKQSVVDNHSLDLLNALNFSEQSLACLFILRASLEKTRMAENQRQETEWALVAKRFLMECNTAQFTSGPLLNKFLDVIEEVKKEAISNGNIKQAIMPVLRALRKFAPSAEYLTPVHQHFFQLCLMAKNYAAARETVMQEVFEMNPQVTLLQPRHFLLYCYFGGRLCIGLKCYQRASELFHFALVAPTLASNAITLAIYKHYFLLSLLEYGDVPELPRYTPTSVIRLTQLMAVKPYARLADAFRAGKREDMESVIQEWKQVFEEDKTIGLAKQVISRLPKKRIDAVMRCYTTRSLRDIATAAHLSSAKEAERLLLILVKEKQLRIEISSRRQMVTFLEESDRHDEQTATLLLDEMTREAMQLGARMQEVEDRIELDPEYRTKVLQAKQHSKLDC